MSGQPGTASKGGDTLLIDQKNFCCQSDATHSARLGNKPSLTMPAGFPLKTTHPNVSTSLFSRAEDQLGRGNSEKLGCVFAYVLPKQEAISSAKIDEKEGNDNKVVVSRFSSVASIGSSHQLLFLFICNWTQLAMVCLVIIKQSIYAFFGLLPSNYSFWSAWHLNCSLYSILSNLALIRNLQLQIKVDSTTLQQSEHALWQPSSGPKPAGELLLMPCKGKTSTTLAVSRLNGIHLVLFALCLSTVAGQLVATEEKRHLAIVDVNEEAAIGKVRVYLFFVSVQRLQKSTRNQRLIRVKIRATCPLNESNLSIVCRSSRFTC